MGRVVGMLVVLAAAVAAENDPNAWVYYDSAETARGPRLIVTLESGEKKELAPKADVLLISYIADGHFHRHKQLSISLSDSNRILLHFDWPKAAFKRAELVWQQKLPKRLAPNAPFPITVHKVTAAWNEARTTWRAQPAFDKKPLARAVVQPRPGVMRIDLTAAVKAGLPHGVVVRSAIAVDKAPAPQMPAARGGPAKGLLDGVLRFEPSIGAAKEKAKAQERLVLALVRGEFREGGLNYQEELLAATALLHPDVRALMQRRFVRVRVRYTPWLYTFGKNGDPRDPLPELGTDCIAAKAPALVVAKPDGTHVATLGNIGTYDWGAVYRFLRTALAKGGTDFASPSLEQRLLAGKLQEARKDAAALDARKRAYVVARTWMLEGDYERALLEVLPLLEEDGALTAEAWTLAGIAQMRRGDFEQAVRVLPKAVDREGKRRDEARYYLGCLHFRAGRRAEAQALWKQIGAKSHWRAQAQARLRWPDRIAMYECLRDPLLPGTATTTEVTRTRDDAIARGCAWLVEHQRPNGSWAIARTYLDTDAAATALAARALLEHGQGEEAVKKAVGWLRNYLAETDPARANCWSAHYTLDFFLAAMRKDKKAFAADAQKAADFVAGGQCPNGAWSYSRAWGLRWRGGIGSWPKTDKGRYHSMNTGPSLVSLLRAKAAGLKVKDTVLAKGKEALLAMRQRPGVWTYTWPVPLSFEKQPHASIGRAPACELALFGLGGAKREDVVLTMQTFLEHRAGLRRPAKLHASWMPPSLTSSYFYSFAYLHAAETFDALRDAKARDLLRADLLKVVEADGSWVDHEESGKPYATAMALIVLK